MDRSLQPWFPWFDPAMVPVVRSRHGSRGSIPPWFPWFDPATVPMVRSRHGSHGSIAPRFHRAIGFHRCRSWSDPGVPTCAAVRLPMGLGTAHTKLAERRWPVGMSATNWS
eukprot:7205622-Prymnesium_polylepis.1